SHSRAYASVLAISSVTEQMLALAGGGEAIQLVQVRLEVPHQELLEYPRNVHDPKDGVQASALPVGHRELQRELSELLKLLRQDGHELRRGPVPAGLDGRDANGVRLRSPERRGVLRGRPG